MNLWSKRVAGGAAAVMGAAAAAWYLNERLSGKPRFATERKDGAFSIRLYPPLIVAETVDGGERSAALNSGFDCLAGYIFAKDRPSGDTRRVAMTAPVLSDEAGGGWRTRFVMPKGFTETALPRPGAGVRIGTMPARRVAAYQFAGRGTDRRLSRAEDRLRDWLLANELAAAGPIEYAFYNSPFIPGPLRRNEVLIPLAGEPPAPPPAKKRFRR